MTQAVNPSLHRNALVTVNQTRDRLLPYRLNLTDFKFDQFCNADRGSVRKRVSVGLESLTCHQNRRKHYLIHPDQKLVRRRSRGDFVHQPFKSRMRNLVESQRRLTHLADAATNRADLFAAKVRVMAKQCFEFIDRLRRDLGGQRLVQPFEHKVKAFPASGTLLDTPLALDGSFKRT